MKKLLLFLLPITVALLALIFGSYTAWPAASTSASAPTSTPTPTPSTPSALPDEYQVVVEVQIVDDVTGELIENSTAAVQLVVDGEETGVMVMQGPVFQMPLTLSTIFRWEPSAEGYEPSPGVYSYAPYTDTLPAGARGLEVVESRLVPKKGGE